MRAIREPMVWLMLAIPLATIVGGILTIRMVSVDPLDAAPEPVARRAQIQTTDLAPDQRAQALGLGAELVHGDDGRWRWQAWPASEGAAPTLSVLHPTLAGKDLHFELAPDAAGKPIELAVADLPLALCEFRLEDLRQGWRLVGRYDPATRRVVFHSKLSMS